MMVQPVETNNHPEFDTTELMDSAGIKHYQCLNGELQWAVSLGRCDILQAVMSMSRFRAAPREGHLRCIKCFMLLEGSSLKVPFNSALKSLPTKCLIHQGGRVSSVVEHVIYCHNVVGSIPATAPQGASIRLRE